MPKRYRLYVRHALLIAALGAVALLVVGALPATALRSSADPVGARHDNDHEGPVPEVERLVASDMVVDWIGGAPEESREAMAQTAEDADHRPAPAQPDAASSDDGAEDAHAAARVDDAADGSEHHDAGTGGYAVFSQSARWLPSGYSIRLAGADSRIEQYRGEIDEAARAATAITGVPIQVAPAAGGSVDPARGEIVVVLGSGPCGSPAVGCGGPALTATEIVSGRVWVDASALGLTPSQRTNLAAHELGHALGLQHFDSAWADGRQVMFPTIQGTTSFRSGDGAGLRFLAGSADRSAGSVTWHSYAAGRARVAGTITSGSRVRITSGSSAIDVAAEGGTFAGALRLPAGSHVVCVRSLDAAAGFRRDLGCVSVQASGAPVGHVDPAQGSFETIRVGGWAIDPQTAGPVDVQVIRDGALVTTVRADQQRGDLGKRARNYGTAHGFVADIPAVAGSNRVCVRILGVGAGGALDAGCSEVVHSVDPLGALEDARSDGLAARVSGWALDPNTRDPVSLRITVDGEAPTAGGTFRASQDRSDVAEAHPSHGRQHGFAHRIALAPGRHELCVTVLNVGLGQDRSLGCAQVYIEEAGDTGAPLGGADLGQAAADVVGAAAAPGHLVGDAATAALRR
jgi:hypothetical protein